MTSSNMSISMEKKKKRVKKFELKEGEEKQKTFFFFFLKHESVVGSVYTANYCVMHCEL